MNFLLPILYILGLYSAYMAGSIYVRARSSETTSASQPKAFHVPWTTLFLFLIIVIPTTLQFFSPGLLPLLQRDTTRFMNGEWWRLITSLLVQDGGIGGAIFNLISLLLIGFVAEQFWDSKRMLILFFVGGIVGQLVGLAWQPIGAGNSVANFSLAASVAATCLMRRPSRPVQIAALLALAADIILIALKDIHGPAALTGAILALVVSRISKPRDEKLG